MGVKLAKGHRPPRKETDDPRRFEEALARQLLTHAQHAGSPPAASTRPVSESEDAPDVLLDCEVDGAVHAPSPLPGGSGMFLLPAPFSSVKPR